MLLAVVLGKTTDFRGLKVFLFSLTWFCLQNLEVGDNEDKK